MHLQADRMAQAVRIEHRADAFLQHAARIHVHDAQIAQHATETQMRLQMQVAVIGAGTDLCAQGLLLAVDGRNQLLVKFKPVAMGAGDVGGIAVVFGAGIDQQ